MTSDQIGLTEGVEVDLQWVRADVQRIIAEALRENTCDVWASCSRSLCDADRTGDRLEPAGLSPGPTSPESLPHGPCRRSTP